MKISEWAKRARRFSRPYCITRGETFRLADIDPGDTQKLKSQDKPRAKEALQGGIQALAELQEMLYAQDKWAVLLIFQAMDAAGKDGAIKHVMSGINPQGCEVYSFKAPSNEDLDHDFMWRCLKYMPQRGRIGIFNRSYYEETLVVRVHPEMLVRQKIPTELITKAIWDERFEDIRHLEEYLGRNGVKICKFFLHVSKKEQKRRFMERLETPEKHWKFSSADIQERQLWKEYMKAYEQMIRNTATAIAPWYVIPADNKWFTRLAVAAAVLDTLWSLDLSFPKVSPAKLEELAQAKQILEQENQK